MSKTGQRQRRYEPGASPTEIALAASCSRPLVYRLMSRGLSREQIIERFANRSSRRNNEPGARAPARPSARPARKGKGKGKVNVKAFQSSSPSSSSSSSPGSNGHGHSIPPPFIESQAAKEAALAGLRTLELEQKRGVLAPAGPLQAWVLESVSYLRNHTWGLPAALREHEHSAAADLVERVLHRTFREWERYSRSRAQHHGLRLPPPLPPPPLREQLTYFERYVRDAMDGTVEIVSNAEQIGSVAWRRLHPSVTTQQAFELAGKKREWDAAMCGLLKSRATWDLPEETAPPESIEVEEL